MAGDGAAIARRLIERGLTLAVAESCTGGLLGDLLTSFPGSSRYFIGGVIAYADAVKTALLGVDAATIGAYGAVSREVALEMAIGVRERLGTDLGVGITGIAGPDGGTAEKPVGLVFVAVVSAGGTAVKRCQFHGSRSDVKTGAAGVALELIGAAAL